MRKFYSLLSFMLFLFSVNTWAGIDWGDHRTSVTDGELVILQSVKANDYFFTGSKTTQLINAYTNDETAFYIEVDNATLIDGKPGFRLKKYVGGLYVQKVTADNQAVTLGTVDNAAVFQITLATGITTADFNDNVSNPSINSEVTTMIYTADKRYLNCNSLGGNARLSSDKAAQSCWNMMQGIYYENYPEDLGELITKYAAITPAVGSGPGYATQEAVTEWQAAVATAQAIYDNGAGVPQECKEQLAIFQAAYNKMMASIEPMKEGYYRIVNAFKGFFEQQQVEKAWYAATGGNQLAWKSLNLNDASQVWYITPAEGGGFKVKNLMTETFVRYAESGTVAVGAEPYPVDFTLRYTNGEFQIRSTYKAEDFHVGGHNNGAGVTGTVILWNGGAGGGSSWFVRPVPESEIEALLSASKQEELNKKLAGLLAKSESSYEKATTYTYDANVPLIGSDAQISSNALEPTEGSYAALLDKDTETFFHSQWSGTGPAEPHYLQFMLNEPMSSFLFKFTRRMGNNNNRPTHMNIYASNDEQNWTLIKTMTSALPVASDAPDYESPAINLGSEYAFIRFEVIKTNTGASNNGQPFFTFSEFQLYEAVKVFSQLDGMTSAQPLKEAIATAKTIENATQGDIDALQAAYDAFVLELADPTELKNLISSTSKMLQGVFVGETLGGYTQSSYDACNAVVETARGVVNGVFTKASLATATADLKAAVKTFNASIKNVEFNKWFHIIAARNSGKDYCAGKALHTIGGQSASGIKFSDLKEMDPNHMWRFVNMGDTAFAIQNKATGYYITGSGASGASASTSATPLPFVIKGYGENVINFIPYPASEKQPLHAQAAGTALVFWPGGLLSASIWEIEEVAAPEIAEIKMQYNSITAHCLPYDITELSGSGIDGMMYQVCGKQVDTNGKTTAIKVKMVETVAAGEPFILTLGNPAEWNNIPTADDTVAVLFTTGENLVSEAVGNKNGLVGTFNKKIFSVAGYGYFNGAGLQVTTAGPDTIRTNSAWIDETLITEDAATWDELIPVTDGVIDIIKDVNAGNNEIVDVYTPTGVLVRKAVKSSSATKGLSKGIYLVGTTKVTVK